jgi:hypothetical protein
MMLSGKTCLLPLAIDHVATASAPVTTVWRTETDFNWQGKDPNLVPTFGTYRYHRTLEELLAGKLKREEIFQGFREQIVWL